MTQRTNHPQTNAVPAGIGASSRALCAFIPASVAIALISIITVQPSAEIGHV